MIKHYAKLALRSLLRNKAHSFINIAGLSVGMAVAMLIGLWIYDELMFDRNFINYSHIAQLTQNTTTNGAIETSTTVPFPLGDELRKSFGSDFKYVTMAAGNSNHMLAFQDKKLTTRGTYLEQQAVEMFSLNILKGTKEGLNDPANILLSESSAKAYFGDADPIGKVMKIDNKSVVKVTGVYRDIPQNSTFADMNFIASWELYSNIRDLKKMRDPWRCNCFLAYAQVADNADMDKVSAKIRNIKLARINKSELVQKPQVFLNPMKNWHLYAEFKNGVIVGGRIQYVWMFGIIGSFVLLLACINFMNLSTARSEKRAKDVGIRKVIGSLRSQLITLFLTESLLVVSFAFVMAVLLVIVALPLFNDVAGKKMNVLWGNPLFWLIGISFTLFTGLISGSYPAVYLSSFRPVKALKGTFKIGSAAAVPRKALVVLQFTVSVTLIIGTLVVFRQLQFAKNRPIGYSNNGLIMVTDRTGEIHKSFNSVKDDLLKAKAITDIAEAGAPATQIWSTNSGFDWTGKDPGLAVDFPNTDISADYGKTMGWQFTDGRDFSLQFPSDSAGFVINQSAAKYMGLKNPVGEIVKWDGVPYKVIGVIKDMLVESPYEPVRPSFYHLIKWPGNFLMIKLNPKISAADALAGIEKIFKSYSPAQEFQYKFVEEEYAKKFGNEERIGKLAGFFTGLAIFISCLGLFGMASFMAEQRVKEIGVRKILGASVFNLWRLLSKDFVVLVAISLFIATPLSYYFMHNWLQHYQYRTEMVWWIFVLAGAGAFLITLLTISYQGIKAALSNPIKSLRSE